MARTLDDLAELSGVSRATVSRVINGGSVSEETRRRVLEVIEGTNYRPNLAARSLASGRTGVVGVVMHVAPPVLFEDSYFVALLHGVSDVLADRASGMMLWLGNRSKEETLDRILGTGLMDGVIVSADNLDDPLVDGLLASDLPTVLIGHRRSDLTASYVDIDNIGAADTVTTHLIDIGRTRVGHITGRLGSVAGEDRLTGYRRAMKRAGLDPELSWWRATSPALPESRSLRSCSNLDVDAIFCANDATASGAMETIKAAGLVVPEGRGAGRVRRSPGRIRARPSADHDPSGRARPGHRVGLCPPQPSGEPGRWAAASASSNRVGHQAIDGWRSIGIARRRRSCLSPVQDHNGHAAVEIAGAEGGEGKQ